MEQIEVVHREIGPNYYHKFLRYTDSNGNQRAASGWASDDAGILGGSAIPPAQSGSRSPFGNIFVTNGPYDASYPDHPARQTKATEYQIELIATSDDQVAPVPFAFSPLGRRAMSKAWLDNGLSLKKQFD